MHWRVLRNSSALDIHGAPQILEMCCLALRVHLLQKRPLNNVFQNFLTCSLKDFSISLFKNNFISYTHLHGINGQILQSTFLPLFFI